MGRLVRGYVQGVLMVLAAVAAAAAAATAFFSNGTTR
jgi:hypothetical protein